MRSLLLFALICIPYSLSTGGFTLGLQETLSFAADEGDDAPLSIRVRSVSASGYASEPEHQTGNREVQNELVDVEQELLKLPYRSYALRSDRTVESPLMKRNSISLRPGENITVRPLYRDHGKVCMWMKWEDENGLKVFDSRLHLREGESLVVGTDHTDDSGVILVVNVGRGEGAVPYAPR